MVEGPEAGSSASQRTWVQHTRSSLGGVAGTEVQSPVPATLSTSRGGERPQEFSLK